MISDLDRVQSALAWLICSGALGAAAVLLALAVRLGLGLQQNRDRDVVGIAARDLAQAELVEELLGVLAQVQDDARAARRALRRLLDREAAAAIGTPAPGVLLARLARDHLDLARDHERRIEADPELADQVQIPGAVAAELGDEALGARARDRAEVLDQLVPAHADAVVAHGERAGRPVGYEQDLELRVVAQEMRLGQARVAQPVAGVRRVRDQLPEKDLAMLVERVDDQIENPADLGLERLHGCAHRSLPRCSGWIGLAGM